MKSTTRSVYDPLVIGLAAAATETLMGFAACAKPANASINISERRKPPEILFGEKRHAANMKYLLIKYLACKTCLE